MRTERGPIVTPAARPHYIRDQGRPIFTWHHPPRPDRQRGAGVVLCPPLGADYICAYRSWRILAERLAGLGFDVLRLDYEGTGDSAGHADGPGCLDAWLGNIKCVAAEARKLTGSGEVALVGLRVGATLALQAAARHGGIARLVLWSPFRSGRAYVRELKAFAKLSHKDYIGDEGQDILAAGYILPAAIAQAIEGMELESLDRRPAGEVLLVDRDDRAPDPIIGAHLERLGARVARVRPAGTSEMLERAVLRTVPDAALDAITSWLDPWSPARGATAWRPYQMLDRSAAYGAGYQERGVRFGPGDRLFGILTAPTVDDRTAPALILLNTGFEYRVGPHRLYVPLARELAAEGHVVFRYDLGGIGDSAPPEGAAENIAYPAHALDDLRDAIAYVRKHAPGRRIVLAGLCSGAWHAFDAARRGLQVDAILSVNPPLYLRDQGGQSTPSTEYHEIGDYRRALVDAARWRKALRGESSYANFVRLATAYVRRKISGRIEAAFGGRLVDGLARDLNRISARGITSLFVFNREDSGCEYFQLHGSPALRRREAASRIRQVVVDGAGHTFSSSAAQQTLRELLIDFMRRQRPLELVKGKAISQRYFRTRSTV